MKQKKKKFWRQSLRRIMLLIETYNELNTPKEDDENLPELTLEEFARW